MMFITFEGLDYSGKTTQANLLAERLKQYGKEVVFLREPGGTAISEKIRDVLLDKQHLELTQVAELFLFSAARIQLVHQVIQPSLASGKVVLCDRFYDSTTAYQGYGRGINLDDIAAINRIASAGSVPDITFFIDLPIDEIFLRKVVAGISADRMESAGREFFERVRNGYCMLAESELKRFIVINGQRGVEEIHNEIWDVIRKRIK